MLNHIAVATTTQKPRYRCDICNEKVIEGERYATDTSGLTVEHVDCAKNWFRSNFGREGLS